MRVVLIDDHKILLQGVALLMNRVRPDAEVAMADSLAAGLELLSTPADLVLTDLMMPGVAGIEALLEVRTAAPAVPAVVLAGSEDPATVRQAIDNGASGYIFKSADADELSRAIDIIMNGGVYLPPVALSSEPVDVKHPPHLSERKKDVLRALVRGLSNKEIARELFISDETVKTHIRDIFDTLGVRNRTKCVYAVAQLGIRLD